MLVTLWQVIDMPEHNPGQMGGTMRLGKRRTIFKTSNSVLSKRLFWEVSVRSMFALYSWFCVVGKLYGDAEYVEERHRHRFEVTLTWVSCRKKRMKNTLFTVCFSFSGQSRAEESLWRQRVSFCWSGCGRREDGGHRTGWWENKRCQLPHCCWFDLL